MPDAPGTMDILRFLPHPHIIVVDNNLDHLNLIREGLFTLGLPCITIPYDITEGLAKPERWNGERLRVIFLDLNLSEIEILTVSSEKDASSEAAVGLVGPIGDALRSLALAGPYLIVFWTQHKDYVDTTMKLLFEREQDVPLPFAFTTIEKAPFIPPPGHQHDPEALKKAITSALLEYRLFLSMLAWESEVEGAAVSTFNKVHSLVATRQPHGTAQNEETLQDVMKNMAMAAWGAVNARKDPGAAIASGLAPLLLDHIDSIIGNEDYIRTWNEAITDIWRSELPEGVSAASLNARCLIDLNCRNRGCRGAWLDFSEAALTQPDVFTRYFGQARRDLEKEFINPGGGPDADAIRNSVRLGVLECTAACDYANQKAPLRRYLLCARIPVAALPHVRWENPPPGRDKKHDAIHRIEAIVINGEEFELFIDFRYVLSLPPGDMLLHPDFTVLRFRVRSQVLTDIAARYSAHTTRPGIYSFRSRR